MGRQARDTILMFMIGVAFFLNIIAINLFPSEIPELAAAGYAIFGIGALLYILSVLTLRKKGVSQIVDRGIYGVVRHPMYLGAMIMFFSHIFLGQHWIVAIGTTVAIACCYHISLAEDQKNLEKFGDDYNRYMQKVPRTNFVVGIIRRLRNRSKR